MLYLKGCLLQDMLFCGNCAKKHHVIQEEPFHGSKPGGFGGPHTLLERPSGLQWQNASCRTCFFCGNCAKKYHVIQEEPFHASNPGGFGGPRALPERPSGLQWQNASCMTVPF